MSIDGAQRVKVDQFHTGQEIWDMVENCPRLGGDFNASKKECVQAVQAMIWLTDDLYAHEASRCGDSSKKKYQFNASALLAGDGGRSDRSQNVHS